MTTSLRPDPMFIGDHLAMDFINSTAAPDGRTIEWLVDGLDLVDWLERAGAIEPAAAARLRAEADPVMLDQAVIEARALRTWLRDFVLAHDGRELGALTPAELAPLNAVLVRDRSHLVVEAAHDHHHARRVRDEAEPGQLLQPIAEAIGELICHADFKLVRACEGAACTLIFLDRTKAHRRRWCSMAACGNRAKVAAHRARAAKAGASAS